MLPAAAPDAVATPPLNGRMPSTPSSTAATTAMAANPPITPVRDPS